jgi:cysteine desulfurase
MGLSDEIVEGALRIGIGKMTTDDEIVQAAEILGSQVSQVQQLIDG